MSRIVLAALGVALFGALWSFEEKEDGKAIAYSPLVLAATIEIGVLLLRRRRRHNPAPISLA